MPRDSWNVVDHESAQQLDGIGAKWRVGLESVAVVADLVDHPYESITRVLNGLQMDEEAGPGSTDATELVLEAAGLDMAAFPAMDPSRFRLLTSPMDEEPRTGTFSRERFLAIADILVQSDREEVACYWWTGLSELPPPYVAGRVFRQSGREFLRVLRRPLDFWESPTYWWRPGGEWVVATYTDSLSSYVFSTIEIADRLARSFPLSSEFVDPDTPIDDWMRRP